MKHLYKTILILLLPALSVTAQNKYLNPDSSLKRLTDAITNNQFTGFHSVLILHKGDLVYEHYFNGFNNDSLHDTRSSFKSITSLLIGIAIDQGLIKNTEQKVYDFFREYAPFKNDDPRKKNMTIQNLLDMESGFDCEEFNDSKDCEEEMVTTQNWVKFALDLPMKNQPGTVWAYTSCDPMILSGIIKKVSHMSVMEFAAKYLFKPLGITNYRWTTDPNGNAMTAGSFYIRPMDMLKIGQLVLNSGNWKGRQIVSKKWINISTKSIIPIPDFSFAKSSRSKSIIPQPSCYGDYWYRELLETSAFKEPLLFASGNGGQFIFIIKRLAMVVVFTQGNYDSWKAKRAFEILAQYILPSFEHDQ